MKKAGLRTLPVAQAAAEADIVMMLVPDEQGADVYAQDIAESMRPGKYSLLSLTVSQFTSVSSRRPKTSMSLWLRPKALDILVRKEYTRGAGVPCLLAVHQDPTGDAKQVGLAYASAIGGARRRD
ncbi:MAG: hypothetical protein WKF84_15305 [Pyrinomonadaceae bacterium]